jgi:hypothetical protein
MDLVTKPLIMRALFGEKLRLLRGEIRLNMSRSEHHGLVQREHHPRRPKLQIPLSGRRSRKPARSRRTLSKLRCSIPADRLLSLLTFRKRRSSWTALWFAGTVPGGGAGDPRRHAVFATGRTHRGWSTLIVRRKL